MPTKSTLSQTFLAPALALAIALFPGTIRAADEPGLVSTNDLMDAVAAIDGIRLVAAKDVALSVYTEDYSPPQVVEIIRPDQRPITVGRLTTSCSCLQASLPKRSFAQGERALIEVRNVKPTPKDGATFGLFVQMTSPYNVALQYEIFARSTRSDASPPASSHTTPATPASGPAASPHQPPTGGAKAKAPAFTYEDIQPYPPRNGREQDPGNR